MKLKITKGHQGGPVSFADFQVPPSEEFPEGRAGRALCLFDRKTVLPQIGDEVEAMFCTIMRRSNGRAFAFLVQQVTSDHVLLPHNGFECSGSMCTTTADTPTRGRGGRDDPGWLTPGRTPVVFANNVSTKQGEPLTPGFAYVSRTDMNAGLKRIAGVPSPEYLDPHHLADFFIPDENARGERK